MDNITKITDDGESGSSADNKSSDSPLDSTSYKAMITDNSSLSATGIGFENEVKLEYGDVATFGVKESGGLFGDSLKYGIEREVKLGDDKSSVTVKSGNGLTVDNIFDDDKRDFGLKRTESVAIKRGNKKYDENSEINVGYDGNGLTFGHSTDSSVKIGDDDAYVKESAGQSTKFGPGYSSSESHYGVEAKLGPLEGGVKQTNSYTNEIEEDENGETVETETLSQKNEVSGSVDVGSGVKVKSSVEMEQSEKFSQSAESDTEESTIGISSKTRIEVDEEKAGKGVAVMAGIFNAAQSVKETVLKDAFTMTDTVEHSKGGGEENEAQIEDQAQEQEQEQEAEGEIERESEEERMKAELEEDARVEEELQRQSDEMMDEYENDRGYDPQEYAEELDDYSYDIPGEGVRNPKVDLENNSEGEGTDSGESSSPDGGESADNDYDYGYGY